MNLGILGATLIAVAVAAFAAYVEYDSRKNKTRDKA